MKIAVIIVVVLIIVVAVLAILAPKNFALEREITINKPKSQVFDYLKILKNQDNWNPWTKKDPNIQKTFKGVDGQPGFISSWKGNKEVGEGQQEILKIVEGDKIDYELRFKKPFEATNWAYIQTEAVSSEQTKVKWGMSGNLKFPTNIPWLLFDIKSMLGKDYDEGLTSLKVILEK